MKKFLILTFCCALCFSCFASKENKPNNTRNLSKYVENKFADNEIYQTQFPYETVKVVQPVGKKVKNIILIIGDGMGLTHVSSAWVVNRGKLNLDNFPFIGFSRTYSANHLITDSGAGGTALSTGHKTNNYVVGVDTLGNPLVSVIEEARKVGKRTGVSVVCRLNDATPADFCCHNTDREQAEAIVADYLNCGVDYIVGGGMKYWRNRTDNRDMIAEMIQKGYHVAENDSVLMQTRQLPVLAVLADLEFPIALRRGDLFQRTTMKGVQMLSNKNGFFMMVEGSCIDDWSHANKAGNMLEEVLDLDRTIGQILQWAEKDGETLVVVTADHETGGLTLLDGDIKAGVVGVHFASEGHSNMVVPVYAYGPQAEQFMGIYENAQLGQKILNLLKGN